LRRRLAAEGIEQPANLQSTAFDQALEAAVIRFQRRQGLEPDGVIGPKTRAALNVPVGQRVWQIMVNMERWRWLPRHLPTRRLEVNIAAARLDVIDGTRRVLRMRTVVGSPRHPTPVLASEIRAVVINPSWNVPTSIWKREIFPSLRRNQNYLAARHMEIIGRPQDPQGRRIDWRSHRTPPPGIQIRQIPGPFNALGRVKFHIPNRFDVYLHDTPQRSFFKRADRALSHGCIRLEQPDRLLAFLFPDEAMRPQLAGPDTPQPRTTQTVAVAEPLPVFLLYWTAFAGADGTMHFRDDIYGHDSEMIAALSRPGRDMQQASLATGCREKQNQT
jgi:murein L,D-transpeptidase YcbB/YkuD